MSAMQGSECHVEDVGPHLEGRGSPRGFQLVVLGSLPRMYKKHPIFTLGNLLSQSVWFRWGWVCTPCIHRHLECVTQVRLFKIFGCK